MKLRDDLQDWRYMISKDNSKSRGFYLMVTIMYSLILICALAFIICLCIGLVPKSFIMLGIILVILALFFVVGTFMWLASK